MKKPAAAASGPLDRYISNDEFAAMLGVDRCTPYKWRREGKGPKFVKLGRGRQQAIRYSLAAVERWLSECSGGDLAVSA